LETTVSKFAICHVDEVVDIHLKSFPGFFLSFLGPRFLKEFYKSFATDSQGLGFVAKGQDDKIIGVVVGPIYPQGYFQRLLKNNWPRFCLASIGAVVRRPHSALRLLRAIFYRGKAPFGPPRALLSSIAVDPSAQGRGVGKVLVERWVEQVQRNGLCGCYLTTDADGNLAVNNFYQNLGWQIESSYVTSEGRRMNRYVYDFKNEFE
jgi:ribosomal protein S18 acetylase RimI-like enzyme